MTGFNYVSLFSGIGGFETALNRLGGNCVLASEIDKFANQSYGALYGEPTAGDITAIKAEDVPDHDVLVGGFPCQSFSVAGKRGGFDDARGTLFFEVARLAKEKQPKVVLLENVKGLVGHDGGKTLDVIVQTLNDIGYHVDFNVLNSKYFGVPQNRERIFIVALRDDIVEPSEWVIEGTNVMAKGKRRIAAYDGTKTFSFDWPHQTEVTTRLRDVLEATVDKRYYLSEEKTVKLVAQLSGTTSVERVEVIPVLTPDREEKRQKGRRFKENDDEAFTITSQDRHGVLLAQKEALVLAESYMKDEDNLSVKIHDNLDLRPHRNDIRKSGVRSITIVNHEKNVSNAVISAHEPKIYGESTKYRIRKLTPLECWRLQGFSDEQHQTVVNAGLSDSQRYKQAGNAVTVNVIQAIGERILTLLIGK